MAVRTLAIALAPLAAVMGADEIKPIAGGGDPLIRDFLRETRGNLVYRDGTVELHPKAIAGVRRNDNLDATPDGRAANGWFAGAGVDGQWHATPSDRIDTAVEAMTDRYPSIPGRDLDGGRVAAAATHNGPEWQARLGGGVSRRQQESPLGATLGLDIADAEASAGVRGRVSEVGLALRAASERWRTPGPGYIEAERDLVAVEADLRAAYRLGERTAFGPRISVDHRNHPETGRYNDSFGWRAVLAGSLATGDRSWLDGEAGLWWRRYADDFAGDAAYDDRDASAPVGSLVWTWDWEAWSRFLARVGSGRSDGYRANSLTDHHGELSLTVRLARESDITVRSSLHRLIDSGAPSGEEPREADETRLGALLRHGFGRGLELRLRADRLERSSSANDDFTRWVYSASVGVLW